jgi:RimJ/RimL family protein N-acetyltransferase
LKIEHNEGDKLLLKLWLDLPSKLETQRLILRPYQDGDEVKFLEMLRNGNRDYLDGLLGHISQYDDLLDVKIYLRERSIDWRAKNKFVLSYWEKSTNNYLSHIWIEPDNWDIRLFEIGWFVIKLRQGEGLATEATIESLIFLFKFLKANKVKVTIRDHGLYKNKSIALAKRCGFKQEGFFRDCVKVFSSQGPGPTMGVYYFGLLRTEAIDLGFFLLPNIYPFFPFPIHSLK